MDTAAALRAWATAHARTVARDQATPAPAAPAARQWDPGQPFTVTADEGRHLVRERTDLTSVCWMPQPDGRRLLAVSSFDDRIVIRDAESTDIVRSLDGHTGGVFSLAWTSDPDGRQLLASASFDGTAQVWDPETGDTLQILTGHTQRVYSVAWSPPDGGLLLLATGGEDQTARIWDPATGECLRVITGHTGRVFSVAWPQLPGGVRRLATAGTDGSARIWDPGTGECLQTISASEDELTSIDWTRLADGRVRLAVGTEHQDARILNPDSGESPRPVGRANAAWRVAWAALPGGRLILAVGGREETSLWNGHTGDRLLTLPGHVETRGIAMLPAGDAVLIASACSNGLHLHTLTVDPPTRAAEPGEIRVSGFEDVTPEPLQDHTESTARAQWVRLGGDRPLLATGGDRDARVWDPDTGQLLREFAGHTASVYSVTEAELPGGRHRIATGSADGTARIWDAGTGESLLVLNGHTSSVYCTAWVPRPDGAPRLVTSGADSTLRIWDPDTGRELQTLRGHTSNVYFVSWTLRGDGRPLLASAGDDRTARIWDLETGEPLRTLTGHDGPVITATWARLRDGALRVATSSHDQTVRIWDPETGECLSVLTDHRQKVYSAVWLELPDGAHLLASAGRDSNVRIWDPSTGEQLAVIEVPNGEDLGGLAWQVLDNGEVLIGASPSNGIRILRVHLAPSILDLRAAGPGPGPEPRARGPAGSRLAVETLLRCGEAGLYPSLGLVEDLIAVTAADLDPELPGGLGGLAAEEGVRLLRELRWPARSRSSFAALLASKLTHPRPYTPPEQATTAQLRQALTTALAVARGPASGPGVTPAELRAAAATVTAGLLTLLTIIGPAAAAADPLLPLRLSRHADQLPALSTHNLALLRRAPHLSAREPTHGPEALAYSPGTAGLSRHGNLAQSLPSQLALPAEMFAARFLHDEILYRRHLGQPPPAPQPLTLILDTTPPVHGPAEQVLRLVAHLLTETLWEHGEEPHLITLTSPETALPLTGRPQLAHLWTTRTLEPPDPALATALRTADSLPHRAVLLTHHHTPEGRYLPGPRRRLVTTHQPPETDPPTADRADHVHLPPEPSDDELARAVQLMLNDD